MSAKLPASALLVFAIVHAAGCIRCNNCTSYVPAQCADVTSNDTATLVGGCPKDGGQQETQHFMIDTGETRITRACGWTKFDGDYCVKSNTRMFGTRIPKAKPAPPASPSEKSNYLVVCFVIVSLGAWLEYLLEWRMEN